jgi:hypothetical protein
MKRCVEESETTGDFQLSPLLDRQVCPPVDSKLRKIVSLIGLEFTTMNRRVGRESPLVNTLISVPIAFYASHGPFASGGRSAKFPAWRRGRKSLFASHCIESERLKTLKTIETRRNNAESVTRDVKKAWIQSRESRMECKTLISCRRNRLSRDVKSVQKGGSKTLILGR